MKSLEDQITCVAREIALRKRLYPRFVLAERMDEQKARHEAECMQAVLETLEKLKQKPLL